VETNRSLKAGGVMRRVMDALEDALTFMGGDFLGKGGTIQPHEVGVKEVARWGAFWEKAIGGSQGSVLTDFRE